MFLIHIKNFVNAQITTLGAIIIHHPSYMFGTKIEKMLTELSTTAVRDRLCFCLALITIHMYTCESVRV